MKIDYVDFAELHVAPFKSTHILRPDLLVLSRSLADYGILSPLIVQSSTNIVIDGNERLLLGQSQKRIQDACGGSCPVIFFDCDSIDAQLMHIRLNRGRTTMVAKPVSSIIRNIIRSKKYDKKDMDSLLQMKTDEYQLMMDGSLLKHRDVANHKYSRAWVPVEAPAGTVDSGFTAEKPPNADR
jgi:hypothetical protein